MTEQIVQSSSMGPVRLVLSWLSTPIYLLSFGGLLVVMHLPFMLTRYTCKRCYDILFRFLNWTLVHMLILVGCRVRVKCDTDLPVDRAIVFVSNHQSFLDIPLINWVYSRRLPIWIAKRELAHGVPSISFNLRHGVGILIDRSNGLDATKKIRALSKRIEAERGAACIFPEGTRARDGHLKHFKPGGLMALIHGSPSALIVPLVIEGSWELLRFKMMPVPFGVTFHLHSLPPIEPAGLEEEVLIEQVHSAIAQRLNQIRSAEL